MKWGKKKPSSPSSSRPSLISHVFPNSWLAKFKQMSINSGEKHAKLKPRGKQRNSVSSSPSRCSNVRGGGGRFYGGEGDEFWRLSFGEDSITGKNGYEEPGFPPSSCRSCRSNATKASGKEDDQMMFINMVYDAGKVTEFPRENEAEIRTPRFRVGKEKGSKKRRSQKVYQMKQINLNEEPQEMEGIPRKAAAQNSFKLRPAGTIAMTKREDIELTASDTSRDCFISPSKSRDSYLRMIEEDYVFNAQKSVDGFSVEERLSFEWQKLKQMKIEELKSRSEIQRKSLYISRDLQRKRPKQSGKVKAFSPRTSRVDVCKIKALEDMKKTKLKTKRKVMEGFSRLDSSAEVKFSFNPQKDFRDSMMEMIRANQISQPQELEELLASYLTLNSDHYHDLIIKVFRQVWYDLNQACFDTELENEQASFD